MADNFVYHVYINAAVFVIAGAAIILISLLTISIQSIKAAIANPAIALHNE